MSTAMSRRGVQPTVEISIRSEKTEKIYLECPNDRSNKLDKRIQKTVALVEPVTKHRSNRLASDTPVPYHRCKGPSNAQPSGEVQVAPVTPVVLI